MDLNISKICETALMQAVEEETKPYAIKETSQIILETELVYSIREKNLGIVFNAINASDENVITDRINYIVSLTETEIFTDIPDRQSIQTFKGTILERKTLSKGGRDFFSEQLLPSPALAKKLSEITYEDNKNLRWIVNPILIVNSKNRILQAKYHQTKNEVGPFPTPLPIKTI